MSPKRSVECQICDWKGTRWYGAKGILVDPCPRCSSRVTYAEAWRSDQPVTPDPKLMVAKAA